MTGTNASPRSRILWRLNIHFTALSILAALLIGMGKHSSDLPLMVIVVSTLALIVSDYYEWIRIHRTLSYFGMLGGAAIALGSYWFDQQSHTYYGISNLHAVANMLVYIQIPLMFQRKDQRLFEHWGVFILLEFIVAALLNDNVLFGIALIPSLVVGCSTLIVLAHYISDQLSGTTGAEGLGFFANFLNSIRWKRFRTVDTVRIQMSSTQREVEASDDRFSFNAFAGLLLSNGILLFAIVYFFGLPRLHTGAYEGLGFSKPMVGFSGIVSLDDIGELMLNDDLALRMSLRESRSKRPFAPTEPPYIRGTVLDVYDGRGNWRTSNDSQRFTEIPLSNQLRDEFSSRFNTHVVTIQEQSKLGSVQFSLPPFFRGQDTSRLKYNAATWCLRDTSFEEKQLQTKQRYQFETSAFQVSRQAPYLIDVFDCLQVSESKTSRRTSQNSWVQQFNASQFSGLLGLRDRILADIPSASPMEKALALEDYLATSKDFTYSLLPKVDRENGIDPIEDFAANHRTGHCQYFASTLTVMLRSLGMPARIVVGFRPAEYNDLGNYFVVRQRHAHAWVEVHLELDEVQERMLSIPAWASGGIWLRLDPTPQAEGSNAGGSLRSASQSGQTLEAIEQLWKDGFMDYDSTRQPESVGIFGVSGDGLFAVVVRSIERLALQLQSRTLGGESLSIENWFSWRSGFAASILAIAGLFVFRYMSRMRWRVRRWMGVHDSFDWRRDHRPSWSLFRRMIHALSRVGLHRKPHETPLEFIEVSQIWLHEHGFSGPSETDSLRSLVDAIYDMRYGFGGDLSPEQCKSFDATIGALEKFSKRMPKRSGSKQPTRFLSPPSRP